MQTKTLTGPNIQAALKKARHELGEDVVLIESAPAQGNDPARVTVMVDDALPQATEQSVPRTTDGSPTDGSPTPSSPSAGGYAPSMQRTTAQASEPASPPASGSTSTAEFSLDAASQKAAASNAPPSNASSDRSIGRDRLFPSDTAPSTNGEASTSDASMPSNAERLLESHLQLLHDRLEDMERRFGTAVIGANQEWVTHPLYTHLLEQGLKADTINTLFERILNRGFDPHEESEQLQWALAQELRRRMTTASPQHRCQGGVLVIGPSGAGKTSLLLKLAKHENFFARHLPTVISITPDDRAIPYQNPADLYQRFGLPVQNVQSPSEMDRALQRAKEFDQILIDTPPLPLNVQAAQQQLRRLKEIVAPVMPLQVHLVLNVTRTLDNFDPDYLEALPIRPDGIALTHLDETAKWGRIAEWLLALEKPVHFVSTGPGVPDGVESFSPSWYVEQLMELDTAPA